METELGPMGYTITLKSIPTHFLENIKNDLTVKPIENPNFSFGENTGFPVYRISKSKIYLPRFYGITNYGQPKKTTVSLGTPINLTFSGSLRDIQQQTIDATLKAFDKHGGGLISLDTGLGKTVVALKLIELMKVKTLIVVHAEFLLEQWKARIEQFLQGARVGIIRQGKCETEDVDISIGMIQTIVNREYPKDFFSTFGSTYIDECFPYNQYIYTNVGYMRIGVLYNLWKNKNELPLIRSFNEITGKHEYKKMTYAWEKKNENLLKISYSKSNLKCTENHKILTPNGYIEANKLNVGDLIKCNFDKNLSESMVAQTLNDDQYQLFLGSFLGDGHVAILQSQRYRLKIIHGEKQKEYCEWKASMFNCIPKKIEINGYKKGIAYTFSTRIIDLPPNLVITNKSASVKTCPQWIIDNLDYRGLAIWWMDDGYLSKKYLSGTLSTCSFDEETHIRFIEKFKSMDIKCTYRQEGHGYLSIYFNKDGIISLLNKIRPYLHENLRYKFYNEHLQLFIIQELYVWDTLFLEYGTVKITSIEKIKNKLKKVYDIEVEDNHNFICSGPSGIGPIVHNCHHISSRTFSSIFYKVQTKYMIGLSATPERKDGLSKVIYWFLGPLIISIKRETNKPSIKFIFNPDTYEEKFNKLGKINNPTMITDLTKQQARNELIVKTIKEHLKQNRKILVLSDRREHCEYLLKNLDGISAGVYLGGMKTKDRETTTNCSVILGTYQASGEGFDVPELDTLILATPKSDVEQAIGRILRQKNVNEPLVLDIIDNFSIFKGQYYKRRKFYKLKEFKLN